MRMSDFLNTANGKAEGTYLFDVMSTQEGRMFLMYILTKLGYFGEVTNDGQAAVRTAALNLRDLFTN